MRISDWSSDVCSSDLGKFGGGDLEVAGVPKEGGADIGRLAAVLKLNQKGELEGRWETSKGYAGTLALFPHDKPEVSAVSEAIPDTLQLHKIGRASCRERVCQYV